MASSVVASQPAERAARSAVRISSDESPRPRAARNLRTRSSRLIGLRFAPAQEGTANAMMDRFVHLSYGLSTILGFIGAKMLLIDVWHPPIWLSLAVIVGVLAVTIGWSLRTTRRGEPVGDLRPSHSHP